MKEAVQTPNPPLWDAVIVGGGAAGLSAAQALGRSLRQVLVIDSDAPRNRFADRMHNVLGLDGTPPRELVARGRAEAERYGVAFRSGAVTAVTERGSALEVALADAPAVQARHLIVATGVHDDLEPLPGLRENWGRGVLHCPYCHGWEVRGQRLGVAVFSPQGIHQVKLLTQWTNDLTAFVAEAGEIDPETLRMLAARGVRLEWDPLAEITSAVDGTTPRVTGARTVTGKHYALDAIFTGSTMQPRDEFLTPLGLERTQTPFGSFIAVDPTFRTSHTRVWAVGNVVQPAASVPIAAAAGNSAGAAVNFALVDEDLRRGVKA